MEHTFGDPQGDYYAHRLAAKRREQTPQALARLTVTGLFIAMWGFLWVLRIPMPVPFLIVLFIEVAFFIAYCGTVRVLPSVRSISAAHWFMLAAEIVFHTTMVYFLGGVTWLGAFAYVFGLIFTNTFLDLKQGAIYTAAAATAFAALVWLDASGTIRHYSYLTTGPNRADDWRLVATTMLGAVGVFFSIYLWINWVGHQLRQERNSAIRMRDELQAARLRLEDRVRERTAALEFANASLAGSEELLRATLESTADGILVVDEEGSVAHANARFLQLWRIPEDLFATRDDGKLLAFVLGQLADPEEFLGKVRELYQTTLESFDELHFADGRVFERFSRPLFRDGAPAGRVWSFRDVTEQKRAEEVLRRQARHDALTSLLNHAAITDALLNLTMSECAPIAVVMVDVDGMKSVNDVYGHQVGDAVLVEVARLLEHDGALVGRYGGDEFLVVMPSTDRTSAESHCRALKVAIAATRVRDAVTGASIPTVASIGMAIFPDDAESADEAIRLADHAMYAAKREQGALSSRTVVADDRASRMVGEIVPLLTSQGGLADKLRLVSHRLAVGAGYDLVRFNIPGIGVEAGGNTTYSRAWNHELIERWESPRRQPGVGALWAHLAETRRPILIGSDDASDWFNDGQRAILDEAGIQSSLVVPMLWQDQLVGMLSVATKNRGGLDSRDAQFLMAVANQVTAIVQMETLVGDLQSATSHLQEARADTVVLLAAAAEAHDHTTGRHLQRVRTLSEALATELGYDDERVSAIGLAATLHDIGKMRVPEAILLSPGQLGDDEWAVMKQHTLWGAAFLAGRPGFEMASEIAAAHHERWDGTGYPRGLVAEEIPEVAAIVSVADSLDAITNDRPYRTGRPVEWAVQEIVSYSGRQFSPRVVEALVRLHARGDVPLGYADDEAHDVAA